MAIERKASEGLIEFKGKVVSAVKEDSKIENVGSQYHIQMEPIDVEVKGESGFFHEWVRLPPTATETSVPEGSVLDRYLQQMELIESGVKKASSLVEAFECLVGNTYLFKRMKLGKSFSDGKTVHEARESWVPVQKIA